MEDYYLVDAKQEYTSYLISILAPSMMNGFKDMFNQSKKIQNGNSVFKNFQILLSNVPNWTNYILEKEVNDIMRETGCDWLDNLITAVFVSYSKILTSVKVGNYRPKTRKIDLKIPDTTSFIHQCYLEASRNFFKNPILFLDDNKKLPTNEILKNQQLSEQIIRESISATIRKLLPFKNILNEYLSLENNILALGSTPSMSLPAPSIVSIKPINVLPPPISEILVSKPLKEIPKVRTLPEKESSISEKEILVGGKELNLENMKFEELEELEELEEHFQSTKRLEEHFQSTKRLEEHFQSTKRLEEDELSNNSLLEKKKVLNPSKNNETPKKQNKRVYKSLSPKKTQSKNIPKVTEIEQSLDSQTVQRMVSDIKKEISNTLPDQNEKEIPDDFSLNLDDIPEFREIDLGNTKKEEKKEEKKDDILKRLDIDYESISNDIRNIFDNDKKIEKDIPKVNEIVLYNSLKKIHPEIEKSESLDLEKLKKVLEEEGTILSEKVEKKLPIPSIPNTNLQNKDILQSKLQIKKDNSSVQKGSKDIKKITIKYNTGFPLGNKKDKKKKTTLIDGADDDDSSEMVL